MSVGTAWPNVSNLALWHLNYKINTDGPGLQIGFKVAEAVEADAKVVALKIGAHIKAMLTTDCEIFYATMSRDDHKRDSRYLPGACGVGTFEPADDPTPAGLYDEARTAMLFRLEDSDGNEVTMKHAPMPDSQVAGGKFANLITAVTGVPGALPADPAPGDAFAAIANNFFKTLVKGTHHVVGGHAPGGVYTYHSWLNCYAMRIGKKKGGRAFV